MHEQTVTQSSITPKMIAFAVGGLSLLVLACMLIFGSINRPAVFSFTLQNQSTSTVTFDLEITDFRTNKQSIEHRTIEPGIPKQVKLKTPLDFDLRITTDRGGVFVVPISLGDAGKYLVHNFCYTKDGLITEN